MRVTAARISLDVARMAGVRARGESSDQAALRPHRACSIEVLASAWAGGGGGRCPIIRMPRRRMAAPPIMLLGEEELCRDSLCGGMRLLASLLSKGMEWRKLLCLAKSTELRLPFQLRFHKSEVNTALRP